MAKSVYTPAEADMRAGLIAAASAYVLWGFLPLYIKLVSFADAREVLGVRILWCVPTALIAILVTSGLRRGLKELQTVLQPRLLGALALSALFIFANWSIYVWLVLDHRVMEASLAYFISPLVNVAMGVFLFGERVSGMKLWALGFAALGVIVQGLALGAPPWMALALCATWSAYSLIRKQAPVPATTGLLVETLALAAPAVGLLVWASAEAPLAFSDSIGHAALLALAGPVTALPLLLFTFGARRVPFTALGLLQYFAPSLQFLIGLAFGELFTPLRGLSFALIWIGLVLYSWDSIKRTKMA